MWFRLANSSSSTGEVKHPEKFVPGSHSRLWSARASRAVVGASPTTAFSQIQKSHFGEAPKWAREGACAPRKGRAQAGWARLWLTIDEREQIGVDDVGVRRDHAVRQVLVGLERAILEELG